MASKTQTNSLLVHSDKSISVFYLNFYLRKKVVIDLLIGFLLGFHNKSITILCFLYKGVIRILGSHYYDLNCSLFFGVLAGWLLPRVVLKVLKVLVVKPLISLSNKGTIQGRI